MINPTVFPDGTKHYYEDNKLHRIGGPAVITPDGTQIYMEHDKHHRIGGPAVSTLDGTQMYFIDGKRIKEEDYEEAVRLFCCKQILES